MDIYFKIKLITEYVVPILIPIIGVLIYIFIGHKEKKIRKYMEKKGYEYYLRDIASVGGETWWAYKKDDISVDEDQLLLMSYRNIKKKYK